MINFYASDYLSSITTKENFCNINHITVDKVDELLNLVNEKLNEDFHVDISNEELIVKLFTVDRIFKGVYVTFDHEQYTGLIQIQCILNEKQIWLKFTASVKDCMDGSTLKIQEMYQSKCEFEFVPVPDNEEYMNNL